MSRRKYFTNRKKQKNIIKKRKLLPKSQPTSLKISVPLYKIKLNRKIICKSSHLPDGWSTVNNSNHTVFCYIQQLFNMWTSIPPKTTQIREQIWKRFSQFTSSTDYIIFWNGFYETIGIQNSPVLSFYVTYTLFIRHWQHKYPTKQDLHNTNEVSHLTYNEQNTLWYLAGYIIRKIKKQMKGKEELIDTFIEEDMEDSDDDEECSAKDWLKLIDRGGLTKCTNDFYIFLRAVELELKSLLSDQSGSSSLGQPKVISTMLQSKKQSVTVGTASYQQIVTAQCCYRK